MAALISYKKIECQFEIFIDQNKISFLNFFETFFKSKSKSFQLIRFRFYRIQTNHASFNVYNLDANFTQGFKTSAALRTGRTLVSQR